METSLNFENQLNHIWNLWIQCNSTHELAVNLRKPVSTDLTSGNQLNIWSKPFAQDLTSLEHAEYLDLTMELPETGLTLERLPGFDFNCIYKRGFDLNA